MRIGLLTPAFSGPTGFNSGIGTHFRHLADALSAAGHEVAVVVITDKRPPVAPEFPYAVKLEVARSRAALLIGRLNWQLHQWIMTRATMRHASRAARDYEVDIWESTSTGSLLLPYLSRRRRQKVALRISTTATQLRASNQGATRWIDRRIEAWEKRIVARADCTLTHSASHRAIIAEEFALAETQIPIIPHGIPLPARASRPDAASSCRILFVGRMEHRKGIDLLIAAVPAVLRSVPGAQVVLVGADPGGYWQSFWNTTAAPELRTRVQFVGTIDAPGLVKHYHDADLFVAPSRYESFGLIFVEAMSHGLPVVALRAPGAADLIQDGIDGCLVPPENPDELARALTMLACNPARRSALGAAARQTVEANYSATLLAKRSLDLYRRVIAGQTPSA